jgi:ubiquinone/menaquinone biosynthesis C-methylase UbiE
VKELGWKNVHVIEGDATEFRVPEGDATLVTFSYSLSSKAPGKSRLKILFSMQQGPVQSVTTTPI